MFDTHGDFMHCAGEPPHNTCNATLEPVGFARMVDTSLAVDLEINDARAANSAPLTWHLQLAMRWVPHARASLLRPLSQLAAVAFGPYDPAGQATYERYSFFRAHEKVVHWYEFFHPFEGGEVVYVKPHFHEGFLHAAHIFTGTADEVGLSPPFIATPQKMSGAYAGTDAGFQCRSVFARLSHGQLNTFGSLEAHMMRTAGARHRCTFRPTFHVVDGVAYDKGGSMRCRAPWSFAAGEVHTAVVLIEYPRTAKPYPWWASVPTYLPMHSSFKIVYEASGGSNRSCYTGYADGEGAVAMCMRLDAPATSNLPAVDIYGPEWRLLTWEYAEGQGMVRQDANWPPWPPNSHVPPPLQPPPPPAASSSSAAVAAVPPPQAPPDRPEPSAGDHKEAGTFTLLVCKLSYGAEIRRFSVTPDELKYTAVHERAVETLGIRTGFTFRYRDEDAELITITTDGEMHDAVRLALSATPAVLHLVIQLDTEVPST